MKSGTGNNACLFFSELSKVHVKVLHPNCQSKQHSCQSAAHSVALWQVLASSWPFMPDVDFWACNSNNYMSLWDLEALTQMLNLVKKKKKKETQCIRKHQMQQFQRENWKTHTRREQRSAKNSESSQNFSEITTRLSVSIGFLVYLMDSKLHRYIV